MHELSGWSKVQGLGLAFGLLLAGCQVLFGDFEFKPAKSGAAVGGGGGQNTTSGGSSNLPTECNSNGTYRCNGAALEMCENAQWVSQRICDSAAQCDQDHVRCRPCAPNSLRCSAFRLERCMASGEGWELVEECKTAARCDAANGKCATCGVDEAYCSGALLNVCNADRTDWDPTRCLNANLCSTTSRSCRPCLTGEYQCNQATLQRCNEAQQWVSADECASNALCEASRTTKAVLEAKGQTWSGKCDAPLCTSGAFRCNPDNAAQLQTCPPSRDTWEAVATCYTAALCDASAGKCKDGCQPGTYQCSGAQLLHCVADGTKFEQIQVCPSAAQCSAAKQTCMPCVAGDYQCNGAKLQRCSASQAWENIAACVTQELCISSAQKRTGVCDPPGCTPAGAQQCGGTTKAVLQVCPTSQLAWSDKQTCATPGLCDKGLAACIPPVCDVAGQSRCTGQNHEKCDANRKNWVIDETCTASQICDVTKGCLGQCPTPAQRCSGKQIEICSVNKDTQAPEWLPGKACPSAALCSVDGTGTAVCGTVTCTTAGQYSCSGQALRVCSDGLDKWNPVTTCTADQRCDAAGKQCDNCVAGNFACSGATLQLCSDDGQTLNDHFMTGCLTCTISDDSKTGYCKVCNSGDSACHDANGIRTCSSSGTITSTTGGTITADKAWNAATVCSAGFGCHDVVGSYTDFCAACPTANEVQCASPSATHVCAADQSGWVSNFSCTYGCVADPSGDDYCASACTPSEVACVGTTGLHTCSSTGNGWGATISECAGPSSLMACSGGVFTGTEACPAATPNCLDGKCVACLGSTTGCADGNTSQTCSANSWVTQSCTETTPYCASGACVACTSASLPTCPATDTRRYCSSNSWTTETCSGATPHCQGGACVACTGTSAPTCDSSATAVRVCQDNVWVAQACSSPTPVCVNGACVQCVNSDWICDSSASNLRRRCVGNVSETDTCASTTPYCSSGSCVACLPDNTGCETNQLCTSGVCVDQPVGAAGASGSG